MQKIIILLISSFILCSCPSTTTTNPNGLTSEALDPDYANNPEAQAAMLRLTNGGTTFPSSTALNNEVGVPPCDDCHVNGLSEDTTITGIGERTRGTGVVNPNGISDFDESKRVALTKEIEAAGIASQPTTEMTIGGQKYRVMNDALKLPNGQYVNFKYDEARNLAQKWGCRLPSKSEALEIRRYAESTGANVKAITREPANNNAIKYKEMENMMNDSDMHALSKRGNDELINGHFKFYVEGGSGNFRFSGFYAPPSCFGTSNTAYCQNGSSGGHNADWLDYSQSARFICPAN